MIEKISCGILIKQIHSEFEKKVNNHLREQDLTMAQFGALLALNHSDKKQLSLKDLEIALHIAQSTTAGIISRLEQKGLVEGFGDPCDKRVKMVRITLKGEKCCQIADKYMEKTEKEILSCLTDTEQSFLLSLLQKIHITLK